MALKSKVQFLEWILQNKAGHFMVVTRCSICNRDSPFVRQRTEKRELHLGTDKNLFRLKF